MNQSKWKEMMHLAITFCILIFITLPLLPLFLRAFSDRMPWPQLVPKTWSLRAWEAILTPSSGTYEAIVTSFIIAIGVTLTNIVLAIPAADALTRYSFVGKTMIEVILYAPIVIPAFVSVMGMHMTLIRLGLTETVIGVIFAHLSPSLPYVIRALMISYATLGFEWEEQGRILGAGRWRRFRYIVLPHLLPGVAAGAGLSMLVSLSQYLITFLIGGGQVLTLPILLFPYASGGDPAIAAAYTLIFAVMAALALWGLDMFLGRTYQRRSL